MLRQGDQMSLCKSGPKCSPNPFFGQNEYINFSLQKGTKKFGYFRNFQKVPKLSKGQTGENSPNLVTPGSERSNTFCSETSFLNLGLML
jgi:hypothetical protein